MNEVFRMVSVAYALDRAALANQELQDALEGARRAEKRVANAFDDVLRWSAVVHDRRSRS
jgi:hypothetical protein